MELNDRKKLILQAIVDEYISSAEPVGSRIISKKNDLGLSSATIRNEMADLEEMGYLVQPHTSAGRIPTDAGYRFYVNSLMRRYKMGVETIEQLQKELAGRISRLDRAVLKAGYMAALLTDYTTVVTTPVGDRADIKKVDLVAISDDTVMLIIVTSRANSRVIKVKLSADECTDIASILNKNLCGKTADEIGYDTIREIERQCTNTLNTDNRIIISILNFVYECVGDLDESEIFVENAKSILKYPEYSDVNKAREIFNFLEDKKSLKQLISGTESDGVRAMIGTENEPEILKDCSLVTVNYSLDGKNVGKLGVIGPKRMNYSQVFASLDLISQEIDKLFSHITEDTE